MGKLQVVSDSTPTGAGSTVLPGVPLPEWSRNTAVPSGWSASGPRGASPLPSAWSVLPLPAEPEAPAATDATDATEESSEAASDSAPNLPPMPTSPLVSLDTPAAPPIDSEADDAATDGDESRGRRRAMSILARGKHRRLSA